MEHWFIRSLTYQEFENIRLIKNVIILNNSSFKEDATADATANQNARQCEKFKKNGKKIDLYEKYDCFTKIGDRMAPQNKLIFFREYLKVLYLKINQNNEKKHLEINQNNEKETEYICRSNEKETGYICRSNDDLKKNRILKNYEIYEISLKDFVAKVTESIKSYEKKKRGKMNSNKVKLTSI